jgi:hypothetical protein
MRRVLGKSVASHIAASIARTRDVPGNGEEDHRSNAQARSRAECRSRREYDPFCAVDEFQKYKQMIGQSMGCMLLDVINPLVERYPDLKPPQLE